MRIDFKNRHGLMVAINIAALILFGLILQIGGAYLVNAAVTVLGGTDAGAAATEYESFMETVRAMEPRQVIHIVFVAPLVEEIVFRLIFLRAGRMLLPFWCANIIQAVLFGIYHGVAIQRVYGFAMGLLIGCVFYYCPIIYRKYLPKGALADLPNSLFGAALTFLLHMVINSSGLFLTPLFSADINVALQICLGLILMASAVYVCFRLYRESESIREMP